MSEIDKILPNVTKRARELGYNVQHFQKLFFLEHFLKQISNSKYRHYFILKGGFEIQSLLGINNRMTQDIDTLYLGPSLQVNKVSAVLNDIFLNADDYVSFTIKSVEQKQLDDDYPGIRVNLATHMGKSKTSISLDISKGNSHDTAPIMLEHRSIINENERFPVYGISVEKIIADKLSAFLKHGMLNTRAKDLFDVYSLKVFSQNNIDTKLLSSEFFKSTNFDHIPASTIKNRVAEIQSLEDSESLQNSWTQYQVQYDYAQSISYTTALDAVLTLIKQIN